MDLAEVRQFLKDNVKKESKNYFHNIEESYLEQVVENWFNDTENYDGRWRVIKQKKPTIGKILDMAAGCGTFVFYGLHQGYDVVGVEPEGWKQEYQTKKISASNYPVEWKSRIINAFGEALPFPNETFDLVTSYQTLEHVTDVNSCILEMLRVLKPGGILYLRAPDYNSFFEPHYRLPFLPQMNKALAAKYLNLLGRPLAGLDTLTWTTEKSILSFLKTFNVTILRLADANSVDRKSRISNKLPLTFRCEILTSSINLIYEFKSKLIQLSRFARREKRIDLWITKLE